MITMRFQELVTTIAYKKGIPNMRITYTPHPITDRPADLCRKYVAGNDPITGKPMLDEIYASLTRPLSAEDGKAGFLKRDPRPRLLEPNTPDKLMEYFHAQGYTDGNPIILPTEQKVAEMLKATSRKPDEWVGQMRPSPPHEAWYYTVEMVAVNAVMAGAKPEYFPTILAIASKGLTSMFSSTSSFARMVVVNGPVVKEIGMNTSIGALGPNNRANSSIGRCWTLISKNLGGSGKPGETYLGSQGNQLNYNNLCFPETEEGLPAGWTPLHVQKGFKKSDSVVSLFSGWSFSDIAWYSPLPQHEVIRGWLEHFFSFGTGQATLVLDPIVAADVAANGYPTKEAFAKFLAEKTGTPGWLYWSQHERELKQAKEGVEPYAGCYKQGEGAVIPVSRYTRGGGVSRNTAFMASKDNNEPTTSIEIVVTGGGTNTFWSGGDFGYAGSASVDQWR
ncbi:MAG: Thiol-disulfide oxidoreductase protein [Acidobacteria bacterium]|nr:Thiol-disulfide oxidoreductase protein [Acidobacteriota bacterium]